MTKPVSNDERLIPIYRAYLPEELEAKKLWDRHMERAQWECAHTAHGKCETPDACARWSCIAYLRANPRERRSA